MTDADRTAVYAAETSAFDGTSYEALTSFEHLLALAAVVTSAPWWPHGPIAVVRARADAGSSSARQRGAAAPVVRLAANQFTPATLLHEFAHVLAGIGDGHGALFRCAYADLVGFVFGPVEAGWLLDAYGAMGLGVCDRTWAAPAIRPVTGAPLAL